MLDDSPGYTLGLAWIGIALTGTFTILAIIATCICCVAKKRAKNQSETGVQIEIDV